MSFEDAFYLSDILSPTQLYDININEKQQLVLNSILQNVSHKFVKNFRFKEILIRNALFTYEKINYKPIKLVEETTFPSLPSTSPFPSEFNKQVKICLNRNPFGILINQLKNYKRVSKQDSLIIVDFELYYQTKTEIKISEIAATKIINNKMTVFHQFIAPDFNGFNPSAHYTSKYITQIPNQKVSEITYVSQEQGLKLLNSFIGKQKIIFGKGVALEQQILQNQQLEEIYPYFCQQKGYRIPEMNGQRCYFHQKINKKYHCALDDVTMWGKLFID